MSINDWGSPKLAAIKLLHDELIPLAICNNITIMVDSPTTNIVIQCINPHRDIGIQITDDGKINITYNAMNHPKREITYEIADPQSAPKTLNYILKNDQELLKAYIKGWQLVIDKWEDTRRKLQPIIGETP